MSRFSIVVPVHKVASYLRDCLDSVRGQDFGDWECICVNDGSPDESGAILDCYARMDGRIRVVHHRNVGLPGARNRALDVACGDYTVFLDSDDLLAPGILRYSADLLKSEDADAVSWQHRVFRDGEDTAALLGAGSGVAGQEYRHTDKSLLKYLITNKIMYGFVWLFCIRRVCIGSRRFLPVGYVEDMMFVADMASELHSLIETSKCGIWYRRRIGQITAVCNMASYRAQQQGWVYTFRRYGALCRGDGGLYELLVTTVRSCLMQNTVALCCYGESSGLDNALRLFFRHEPELKPPLNTLKAVLCRLVATPGVSAPVRMGLRVVGRVLMYARQRRE